MVRTQFNIYTNILRASIPTDSRSLELLHILLTTPIKVWCLLFATPFQLGEPGVVHWTTITCFILNISAIIVSQSLFVFCSTSLLQLYKSWRQPMFRSSYETSITLIIQVILKKLHISRLDNLSVMRWTRICTLKIYEYMIPNMIPRICDSSSTFLGLFGLIFP